MVDTRCTIGYGPKLTPALDKGQQRAEGENANNVTAHSIFDITSDIRENSAAKGGKYMNKQMTTEIDDKCKTIDSPSS